MAASRQALLVLLSLVLTVLVAPGAPAAPKLMVYEVQVNPDPSIQGPDLPIVVNARVGCGGACCYVVYGKELRAEMLLPPGLNLLDGARTQWLSSPGQERGTVAAQPGGGLTWVTARWEVNGSSLGTFELAVRVRGTNDAGDDINETSFANVTLAAGAAISSPIFPHRPVVGRETVVLATVTSRKGVSSVSLRYGPAKDDVRKVVMTPVEGNLYKAVIPASSEERTFWLSMESLDTAGDAFTTDWYRLEVTDPDRTAGIAAAATATVTVASLLGMFLMLYLGGRAVSSFRAKGIFLVGDARMEAALREREALRSSQKRLAALRWKLLAALLLVMLVLLVVSVVTGQLDRVVSHTTNRQEATLWP